MENGPVRPAFRYCAGWVCAAVAATTVSWVAIRDVVATAAVGDPVPSGAVVAAAGDTAAEATGPARDPAPTASAVPSVSLSPRERVRPGGGATGVPTGRPTRDERSGRPGSTPATSVGDYRGYVLTGGQVVVQLEPLSASLVTAVPAPGFETQTWKADGWFRVDFVSAEHRSSIIVAFAGHPPIATVTET
jgi:hypothetical protein